MDELFTVDNMRSRAVLLLIFGYLSLEDLLELQEVSPLVAATLQNYRYKKNVLVDNQVRRYPLKDGIDKLKSRSGPLISHMWIRFKSWSEDGDLDWLWSTFTFWSTRVKRLKLTLDGDLSSEMYAELNQRTDIALGQKGVTFSRCTELSILSLIQVTPLQKKVTHALRHLLRHFPVVESLTLKGCSFPLLSEVPSIENLRKLDVSVESYFQMKDFISDLEPITANFERLESLSLHLDSLRATKWMTPMTGISWLESFTRYTPTRLTTLRLESLCEWTYPLMSAIAPNRLILVRDNNSFNMATQDVSQPLRNIRKLTILIVTSSARVHKLLTLTPSLEELQLNIDDHFRYESVFNLNHRFPSLTRLVINGGPKQQSRVSPAWLESIRRNASPAGLKILYTNEKLEADPHFYFS